MRAFDVAFLALCSFNGSGEWAENEWDPPYRTSDIEWCSELRRAKGVRLTASGSNPELATVALWELAQREGWL